MSMKDRLPIDEPKYADYSDKTALEMVIAHRSQFRGSMYDRTISEFGHFLTKMRKYLTFGERADGKVGEFQKLIDRDQYSGSDINDYIILFAMYDIWCRKQFAESDAGKNLQETINNFLDDHNDN